MANFRQYTGRQIIQKALREIVVIHGPGQTTGPDFETELLDDLNDMVDAWSIDGRKVWAVRADIYTLTAGIQGYWIGPGAASEPTTVNGMTYAPLVGTRPTGLEDANLIINTISPAIRRPIRLDTYDRWAAIGVQQIPFALPLEMWYDGNFSALGDASILLWPGPLANYQIELFNSQNIGSLLAFADLTTTYAFPPGYAEAVIKCLAVKSAPKMASQFRIDVSQVMLAEVKVQAREALERIESYNAPNPSMACDDMYLQGGTMGWNWGLGVNGTRTRP